MKLLDISVNNFRSIHSDNVKISLEGSDIIFVFGQNNAGKFSLPTAYEYMVTPEQKSLLSDFLGLMKQTQLKYLIPCWCSRKKAGQVAKEKCGCFTNKTN